VEVGKWLDLALSDEEYRMRVINEGEQAFLSDYVRRRKRK
jgi:hypothetical protein